MPAGAEQLRVAVVVGVQHSDGKRRLGLAVVLHQPGPPQAEQLLQQRPGHRAGPVDRGAQAGDIGAFSRARVDEHPEHRRHQIDLGGPVPGQFIEVGRRVETGKNRCAAAADPVRQHECPAGVDERGRGQLARRSEAKPRRAAGGSRARPTGTSQRYDLTHCHPGQDRTVYPKSQSGGYARWQRTGPSHCACLTSG